jgi:hypothetical protein
MLPADGMQYAFQWIMTHRYVNDSATLEDSFGIASSGDLVARLALEADTPFTIGVTGKWGSGKTSLLRRAFATLKGQPVQLDVPLSPKARKDENEPWERWAYDKRGQELAWEDDTVERAGRSLVVWYSPWQHQAEENPLVPLLLEIRSQYATRFKIRDKLTDINRRGGLAGLALIERVIDAAAGLKFGRSTRLFEGTTDAVRKAWRDAAPAEPEMSDGQRFHLLFEDAVETLLAGLPGRKGDSPGRLIVFIDDLDRCEESVTVRLLESIKLYLGSRHCVFTLALDEGAVLEALRRHWAGRSDDSNREYLEKLFQVIVPVPVPRPRSIVGFARQQFERHEFPCSDGCAELVSDLLEPNPRKIKNFVNSACASWVLFKKALRPPADEERDRLFTRRFLLFHYLRIQHKPVWRLLERQPWALMILTQVLTGSPPQLARLPAHVDADEQRMMEHLFERAFSHVLKDDKGERDRHRHLPILDAVSLFQERIDRKRSDECFLRLYKVLVPPDMSLLEDLLYLPEPPNG